MSLFYGQVVKIYKILHHHIVQSEHTPSAICQDFHLHFFHSISLAIPRFQSTTLTFQYCGKMAEPTALAAIHTVDVEMLPVCSSNPPKSATPSIDDSIAAPNPRSRLRTLLVLTALFVSLNPIIYPQDNPSGQILKLIHISSPSSSLPSTRQS